MKTTVSIGHEAIARRAHQLWEEAGQPDGQDAAHWLQAERELHAQRQEDDSATVVHGKSTEPSIAAEHIPDTGPHTANYVHPGVSNDSLHHRRNR